MITDDLKNFNKYDDTIDYSYEDTSEAYLNFSKTKPNSQAETNFINDNNHRQKLIQNYALMNRFLKEQSIESDPKDFFKRRTINIYRKQNNFGFDLQSFGLLNFSSKQIEYIFYVSCVYQNTPAYSSGLRIGDVLIAINGISIDEFKNLNKLIKYVKEQMSIRLVVLSENICKKIDYQKKINQIQKKISDKLNEYNALCKEEERILRKRSINNEYGPNYDKSIKVSNTNSSLLNLNSYERSFRIVNEYEKRFNRNSHVFSNNSSLTSPSSSLSADEIYNYNEHDSSDETEWIITRL